MRLKNFGVRHRAYASISCGPAAALAAMILAATMLVGCGQTGALYFDEDPPADQLPPSLKSSDAPIPAAAVKTAPTEAKKE